MSPNRFQGILSKIFTMLHLWYSKQKVRAEEYQISLKLVRSLMPHKCITRGVMLEIISLALLIYYNSIQPQMKTKNKSSSNEKEKSDPRFQIKLPFCYNCMPNEKIKSINNRCQVPEMSEDIFYKSADWRTETAQPFLPPSKTPFPKSKPSNRSKPKRASRNKLRERKRTLLKSFQNLEVLKNDIEEQRTKESTLNVTTDQKDFLNTMSKRLKNKRSGSVQEQRPINLNKSQNALLLKELDKSKTNDALKPSKLIPSKGNKFKIIKVKRKSVIGINSKFKNKPLTKLTKINKKSISSPSGSFSDREESDK